jgi:hypothetical protein
MTFKPSSNGSKSQCGPSAGQNWACAELDGGGYLYSPFPYATWYTDLYNHTHWNPYPWRSDIITSVRIEISARLIPVNKIPGSTSQINAIVKTHGSEYPHPTPVTPQTTTYASYFFEWLLNPNTTATWTWDEIDAIEFGCKIYREDGEENDQIDRVTMLIDVLSSYHYELETTQVYVTIHSETTTPITCKLPKPVDIKVNHDVDTQGLNFWSGNRDVYALGRSSKRTTLSGIMWDGCTDGTSTCEDIIHCIRALGKLQQPVAVAGLRYADLNTDYNIISFSWKQQLECTNTYDWELELEWCD